MCTKSRDRTVATRNMVSIAIGNVRKLAWELKMPSSSMFQKNFMPMTAYTDVSRTSNAPIFTIDAMDAIVVSIMDFIPLKRG